MLDSLWTMWASSLGFSFDNVEAISSTPTGIRVLKAQSYWSAGLEGLDATPTPSPLAITHLYNALLADPYVPDWNDIIDDSDLCAARYTALASLVSHSLDGTNGPDTDNTKGEGKGKGKEEEEEGEGEGGIPVGVCMVGAFLFHHLALKEALLLQQQQQQKQQEQQSAQSDDNDDNDDKGKSEEKEEEEGDGIRRVIALIAKSLQLADAGTRANAGADADVPVLAGLIAMWSLPFAGGGDGSDQLVSLAESHFCDAGAGGRNASLYLGHLATGKASMARTAGDAVGADRELKKAAVHLGAYLDTATDCDWFVPPVAIQLATTLLLPHDTTEAALASDPDGLAMGLAVMARYRSAMRVFREWNPSELTPDPPTVHVIRVYAQIARELKSSGREDVPDFSPCAHPPCPTRGSDLSVSGFRVCDDCPALYCSSACAAKEGVLHTEVCPKTGRPGGPGFTTIDYVKGGITVVAFCVVLMWASRILVPLVYDFDQLASTFSSASGGAP